MANEYRMTKRSLNRLLTWMNAKDIRCFRCGGLIVSGDWIHRNSGCCRILGNRESLARYYHMKCYSTLFV